MMSLDFPLCYFLIAFFTLLRNIRSRACGLTYGEFGRIVTKYEC